MDFTEVPVSEPPGYSKKKKGKSSKRKRDDPERSKQDGGVEKNEAKMEPPAAGAATAFPPTFSVSEIKNKQRRHFMFMKLKQEKRKVKAE